MAKRKVARTRAPAKPFMGSRAEAKAAGAVSYVDGTLCKNSHIPTARTTLDNRCIACCRSRRLEREVAARPRQFEGFLPDIKVGEEAVFQGTRGSAELAGAMYYISLKSPCKKGHEPTIRLVSNTGCIGCSFN